MNSKTLKTTHINEIGETLNNSNNDSFFFPLPNEEKICLQMKWFSCTCCVRHTQNRPVYTNTILYKYPCRKLLRPEVVDDVDPNRCKCTCRQMVRFYNNWAYNCEYPKL